MKRLDRSGFAGAVGGFLPGVCSKCDGKRVIYTETE